MKKNYLAFALCVVLLALSGCGKSTDLSFDQSDTGSGRAQDIVENGNDYMALQSNDAFLSMQYSDHILSVRDLSSGARAFEYSLEEQQNAIGYGKLKSGYWMLTVSGGTSSQGNAFVGIEEIPGEAGGSMQFSIFDSSLHLLTDYTITDETALECMNGGLFSVAPDGNTIACGLGSDLYLYDLEQTRLQTVSLTAEVFFAETAFSADGSKLAYYGYATEQDGTAYGFINLANGKQYDFFESGFDALSLNVQGAYAVVCHNVAPDQAAADRASGKLLVMNLNTGDGKHFPVETYEEARIATVTADGKYVITCSPEGDSNGRLRCYRFDTGGKQAEQEYSLGEGCKPYGLIACESGAYAILYTESGDRLSEPFLLP